MLDLKLSTGASVWDAWTYGCMKHCKTGTKPDCPCLPYRMGDVPPHYSVPALAYIFPTDPPREYEPNEICWFVEEKL